MTHETVIYIHGVSGEPQGAHTAEYRAFNDGVRRRESAWPEKYCSVEWGWHEPGAASPTSHELLGSAQLALAGRALATIDREWEFTINPLRLGINKFRPLFIYNLADMFYYVSTQGKNAVRYAVAKQVVKFLEHELAQPEPPSISLTLIGHSAGSVIAFDLLFYLFYKPRKTEEFIQRSEVTRVEEGKEPAAEKTLSDLRRLREMAHGGKLRIRRLFTLGSPITPLAVRSDAVLKILTRPEPDNRLDPAFHGLTVNPFASEPLSGPRWVNIWDKDDPIAWPVEPLMSGAGSVVVDKRIDVSWSVTEAHNAYWHSSEAHAAIARAW